MECGGDMVDATDAAHISDILARRAQDVTREKQEAIAEHHRMQVDAEIDTLLQQQQQMQAQTMGGGSSNGNGGKESGGEAGGGGGEKGRRIRGRNVWSKRGEERMGNKSRNRKCVE